MTLNQHDLSTPLWSKLCAHYEPLLARARARLENPQMPESERIALCWQIKNIKEFLAMAEQPEQKK